MDFISKNKIATLVIVVLVLLNLGTMAMLWIGHSKEHRGFYHHNREGRPAHELMVNELNLTPEQTQKFDKAKDEHMMITQKLLESIHKDKEELFNELFTATPDTNKANRLVADIATKQAELEKATFNHFNSLKMICTPAQQEKLKFLFKDMMQTIRPMRHGRGMHEMDNKMEHGKDMPPPMPPEPNGLPTPPVK